MATVDLSTLIKPETKPYLLIGGPKHGQYEQIPNGQNEQIIMGFSPTDSVMVPVKYVRRSVQGTTPKGTFQREIFVESSLPVEQASLALQAVLLQAFAEQLVIQFMEGGERVGSDHEG